MAAHQSAKKSILSLIAFVIIDALKFWADKTKQNPSLLVELSMKSAPEKSTTRKMESDAKRNRIGGWQ
jgi:hypothetical protein